MKRLCLALAFLCVPAATEAKDWVIDYPQSHLTFTGVQGSEQFRGEFKKFSVKVDFDPDHPEKGAIEATIDTGSAFTGNDERDSMMPQADWFDAKKFPQAHFVSTRISALPNNCAATQQTPCGRVFQAEGTLTIKGIAKAVAALPFTLIPESDRWRAKGGLRLQRVDFGVGAGQWADESAVKHQVDVAFDLAAKPPS